MLHRFSELLAPDWPRHWDESHVRHAPANQEEAARWHAEPSHSPRRSTLIGRPRTVVTNRNA